MYVTVIYSLSVDAGGGGLVERKRVGFDQCNCSTLSPVSSGMGDCLWAGKLSHYVISYPGQLSLAIPPWVGTMRIGNGYSHR